MVNIDVLQKQYFEMDLPVKWKGLEIKPILVKDFYEFASCNSVLEIEKNKTNDIRIIQMSYLDFLYELMEQGDRIVIGQLFKIIELCLGLKPVIHWDWGRDKKGKKTIIVKGICEINSKEFDDFRRIVQYQNFRDYDDTELDDDVKQAIEEYKKLSNSNIESPSLEKQISFIQLKGFKKSDILEMTYRSFRLLLDADDSKTIYDIMKTAEMSGMVTFKNPIDHYLYSRKKDKYSSYFSSKEEHENKAK